MKWSHLPAKTVHLNSEHHYLEMNFKLSFKYIKNLLLLIFLGFPSAILGIGFSYFKNDTVAATWNEPLRSLIAGAQVTGTRLLPSEIRHVRSWPWSTTHELLSALVPQLVTNMAGLLEQTLSETNSLTPLDLGSKDSPISFAVTFLELLHFFCALSSGVRPASQCDDSSNPLCCLPFLLHWYSLQ